MGGIVIERLYYYRGFEIGLRPEPLSANGYQIRRPLSFCCYVRIRSLGSSAAFCEFKLQRSGDDVFNDDFDAVVGGCRAAEQRINLHLSLCPRESLSLNVVA